MYNRPILLAFFVFGALALSGVTATKAETLIREASPGSYELTVGEAAGQAESYNDPVYTLIEEQLSAIKHRDAERAFSLLTSAMHEKFDNAKRFLGAIRFDFYSIYNHESYRFLGRSSAGNDGILQKVEVLGPNSSVPVIVIYRLDKQDDGGWRINHFTILERNAQSI